MLCRDNYLFPGNLVLADLAVYDRVVRAVGAGLYLYTVFLHLVSGCMTEGGYLCISSIVVLSLLMVILLMDNIY